MDEPTPGAPYHADDYVDGAAYVALAGESRENHRAEC